MKLSHSGAKLLDSNRIEPHDGPIRRRFHGGDNIHAPKNLELEAYSRHPKGFLMSLGAFSYVSAATNDTLKMRVGRYCSLARGIRVVAGNHPLEAISTSPWHYGLYYEKHMPELWHTGPKTNFTRNMGVVRIENDVWIGGYCVLKAGITIGTGSVIASGSVVVKDVAPYSIVGGNPARIIRPRFEQEIANRLLAGKWWDVDPQILRSMDFFDIPGFCDHLDNLREKGQLTRFRPKAFTLEEDEIVPLVPDN